MRVSQKELLLLPLREKAGIAYMDVGEGREHDCWDAAVRRSGGSATQEAKAEERKLEGFINCGVSSFTPHPSPLPQGEREL